MSRIETARSKVRPAATTNLIGGRLCLDFVNTVGARRIGPSREMVIRDEKLNDYADVIAWARHVGAFRESKIRALVKQALLQPRKAGRVLRKGLRLREALYGIFKAIVAGRKTRQADLVVLNEILEAARRACQIGATGNGFEWQWRQSGVSLEQVLWKVGESAGELLTMGDLSRLRQCGGGDCGWIFEDATRNRSRHWCDTRDCGNRERVRRFRRSR